MMHRPGALAGLVPTAHGMARCQQRGVAQDALDLIVTYGREVRTHGASKFFLDRKSRHRLARIEDGAVLRRLDAKLNFYVVVADDGALVTAAPRRGRVRR